jgi:UDP:flavonoid glycosyltransferase YjiC (YdhE family)
VLQDPTFAAEAEKIAAWGREHDGAERGAELVEELAKRESERS